MWAYATWTRRHDGTKMTQRAKCLTAITPLLGIFSRAGDGGYGAGCRERMGKRELC